MREGVYRGGVREGVCRGGLESFDEEAALLFNYFICSLKCPNL